MSVEQRTSNRCRRAASLDHAAIRLTSLAFSLTLFALAGPGCAAPPNLVTITPGETDALLANPGMGWQTFHRFADGDTTLQGLPSTSAYFRLYWSQLEPKEGEIDFDRIDTLLARARQAGQKLSLRIMCAGTDDDSMHVPEWLRRKGCPGSTFRYQGEGRRRWVPDMNHRLFQEAHFRFIAALGARYDGHADLDLIDIGSVGLWGEWHMSDTGVDLPSWKTRRGIIDAWCSAFPSTPKLMLIADDEGMRYATRRGCGWRADCLGDLGIFSKTWNHMDHFYLQQVEKSRAHEAWMQAPVAFESCWDMRVWQENGWDIDGIFDYALQQHASYLNNKSMPLPPGARPQVERLLRRMGYRLVLRRLLHPASVRAGEVLTIDMHWENVGVAPPYGDDFLGWRLVPLGSGGQGTRLSSAQPQSIRGWLPGPRELREDLPLPESLPAGSYELQLAVLAADEGSPSVQLAIEGRTEDGWYRLGRIEVR